MRIQRLEPTLVEAHVDLGPPRVVHCINEPYHVYIGRGLDPHTGIPGRWGNPFGIGRDGTRLQVIARYERYILRHPRLLDRLADLEGKTLGCWCAPQPCHGEVLLRLANAGRGRRLEEDL
jgi:Domain of unknown function (DUF4326)